MRISVRFLLALLLIAAAARADEIRLKDGSKIIGTIVGFEDGSFKVQTSYGFAMVRKDQISEIIPSAPKPQPPPPKPKADDKDSSAAAAPAPDATSASSNATNPSTSSAADSSGAPSVDSLPDAGPASGSAPNSSVESPVVAPVPAPQPNPAGAPAIAPSQEAAPAASAASAVPVAPVEPSPEPISDETVGNLYINHTYGFDIYKPPDWDMLPEEMNSLPNAVAAMGDEDSTTLLLIGREARKGTLDAQAAAMDSELHNIYDNFRLLSSTHTTVAGEPAIERHFRGSAADRDWSVTAVTVAHGNNLFTVLGMTYADSDLIQIQENVIARAISSLRFEFP
jgi:hypothetical protein